MFHNKDLEISEQNLSLLKDLEIFLKNRDIHETNELNSNIIAAYIKEQNFTPSSSLKLLKALSEYALQTCDEDLCSEVLLMYDAPGIMGRLSQITKKLYGHEVWSQIFEGITMPVVGWSLDEMSDFTGMLEERYLTYAKEKDYACACEQVAHCWAPDWDTKSREHFLKLQDIDRFCLELNENLLDTLHKHKKEGSLFFTQEIDSHVIAHVKENPTYKRVGTQIFMTKIPFQAKKYLQANTVKQKQYYACHCPWGRSSLLQKDNRISRSFCHCSLGLMKKTFEVAFDRQLTGHVIESVFDKEGTRCIFAVDIPADILKQYT